MDECDGETVPAAVTAKLDQAKDVLANGKSGRVAARLLRKAAKRATKAAKNGDVNARCGAALAAAADGGRRCALCSDTD